ncbi:MAG: hypothetical protein AB7F40_04250 [Victivallaceae bacterium]
MKRFFEIGCVLFVAIVAVLFTGCSALEQKAFSAAGAVDALKVETAGGSATGTLMPNLTMGGAVSAIATAPSMADGSTAAPVISFATRTSWLGQLFGISADTSAFTYIGVPGETSTDTSGRLSAAAKFFEDASSNSNNNEADAADTVPEVSSPSISAEDAK